MSDMGDECDDRMAREAFDEDGCGVCGVHVSSSFRKCPSTSQRICNSCHCRAYRAKRKAGHSGLVGAARGSAQRRRTKKALSQSCTPSEALNTSGLRAQLFVQDMNVSLALDCNGAACIAHADSPPAPEASWSLPATHVACASFQADSNDADGHVPLSPHRPAIMEVRGCRYASNTSLETAAAAGQHAPYQPFSHQPSPLSPTSRLPGPGASDDSQQLQLQLPQQKSVGSYRGAPSAAAAVALGSSQLQELQQRAIAQSCADPLDAALLLTCAHRAQQATPGDLAHRVVLAVLPSVKLHLPDDPPGVVHATSALLEAVLPAPADVGEAAGDSQDQQRSPRPQVAGEAAQVALRLTVFASAGAVACWHEGPSMPQLPLNFCPCTKAPTWQSGGPAGFSLRFPHAFCPQVDLMAATHRHVAVLGSLVLQQLPTISLCELPPLEAQPPPGQASYASKAVHLASDQGLLASNAVLPRKQEQQHLQYQGQLLQAAGQPVLDTLHMSLAPLLADTVPLGWSGGGSSGHSLCHVFDT